MLLDFTCTYCGHNWERKVYNKHQADKECCPRCQDTSLVVRDRTKQAIDYYEGCPPFPVKESDIDPFDGVWGPLNMEDNKGNSNDQE